MFFFENLLVMINEMCLKNDKKNDKGLSIETPFQSDSKAISQNVTSEYKCSKSTDFNKEMQHLNSEMT